MGKKDIMRELREGAEAWRKEQTLEAYIGILETIFNGLRENALIHVPFDFDPETRDGGPAAVRFEDETESLLIPVDLLEETKAQAVPITLRALVKELDHRGSLDGFWIDLGGKGIFIPKRSSRPESAPGIRSPWTRSRTKRRSWPPTGAIRSS